MKRAFPYLLLALILLFWSLEVSERRVREVPYSEFQTMLREGRLAEVEVSEEALEGRLKQPSGEVTHVRSQRVDPDLSAELERHGVKFFAARQRDYLDWLVPMAIFVGLWLFVLPRLLGRLGERVTSIQQSRAKVYVEKDTRVTFEDVAGVDEAKAELQEIVQFLKDPKAHSRLGAHIPRGTLLVGPPGTGKTLLARAVAGEAGVAFFSINGSEFVEMFVGVGAARVRDLFERAKRSTPCIIFIDELDALGRARGVVPQFSGHDEKEQTLNQLLSELDGFDPREGIVVLAATNRPEILDPALLRAGRFDRHVVVDWPDRTGRLAILKTHVRGVSLSPQVRLEEVAALTTGFTGADLANLVNEAALVATRRQADAVGMDDFTAAVERMVAGLEKRSRLLNPAERERIAFHEAGHALVSLALPGTEVVHKVSIVPRGMGALGYNLHRPAEDRYLITRSEIENNLAVLLGGRAAEILALGQPSTGAQDDLARATDLARDMVMRFGMDETLGEATYAGAASRYLGNGPPPEPRAVSETTACEIDQAVRRLVHEAFLRATSVLERNRAALEETARALLARETLAADELPRVT